MVEIKSSSDIDKLWQDRKIDGADAIALTDFAAQNPLQPVDTLESVDRFNRKATQRVDWHRS